MKKTASPVLRNAGGFIAWLIGPGFATGQEILQFFSGYGRYSFAALALNMLVSVGLGYALMETGRRHRHLNTFDHYRHFCGKYLGRAYAVAIPLTLLMLIAVLLSAAGATMFQYFGIPRAAGCVGMALLLLAAYCVGFERMVRVVSAVSPVVIVFAIGVGLFAAVRDIGKFSQLSAALPVLKTHQSSPHWLLSTFLYASLNFLCGSAYYTELGRTSPSRKSTLLGAVIGAAAIMLALGAMNTAILLGGEAVTEVPVPSLAIAQSISPALGAAFSFVLILGMFSSCATTVWSFCSGFYREDRRKNRLFAAGTLAVCLALGLFPFEKLEAVVYPMIGYAGLAFVALVLARLLDHPEDSVCKKTSD